MEPPTVSTRGHFDMVTGKLKLDANVTCYELADLLFLTEFQGGADGDLNTFVFQLLFRETISLCNLTC